MMQMFGDNLPEAMPHSLNAEAGWPPLQAYAAFELPGGNGPEGEEDHDLEQIWIDLGGEG
jgi:hypothetical protein